MKRIVAIVEGEGEVEALPVLLRRIAGEQGLSVDVARPIRIPRNRIVKADELERAVKLAARQARDNGDILILLDADDDCPAELAPRLLRRAADARPDHRTWVVLAKSEYESWFVAAARSIAGNRDIASDVLAPPDPESIRDAKGWITRQMPPGRTYRPTRDQAALTAVFDLDAARSSPSFDKLWRNVTALLGAAQ